MKSLLIKVSTFRSLCKKVDFQVNVAKAEVHSLTGYNAYIPGDMNLIITAPHGGYISPEWIPDRETVYASLNNNSDTKKSKLKTKPDKYTEELALRLWKTVKQKTNRHPHLIICRLTRFKIDPNRNEFEGALGIPLTLKIWKEFHSLISYAKSTFDNDPGLIVDIHGHCSKDPKTQLGYRHSGKDINIGNFVLQESSIKSLAKRSGKSLKSLILEDESFGALLEKNGFQCTPSPSNTSVNCKEYFRGGFICKNYGSNNGGTVDAIQIEAPYMCRSMNHMPKYADSLANASLEFLERHYH